MNANEMAWILKIVERPPAKEKTSALILYKQNCASCHREDKTESRSHVEIIHHARTPLFFPPCWLAVLSPYTESIR